MPPRSSSANHQNRLLASLSCPDYDLLGANLVSVNLPYKCSLYESDDPIEYIHFLESGVASLVNTMKNGDAAEVGTIGNEGLVGLPIVFADRQAPTNVYMQVAGVGLKIKANPFLDAMQRSASMRKAMLNYAHAFFNQVAQSAACNTFHSLEQRCSRWLLMTQDRMQSDDFLLTQEFLAMMLGVRRAGVTYAVNALTQTGLIQYERGHVTIIDVCSDVAVNATLSARRNLIVCWASQKKKFQSEQNR